MSCFRKIANCFFGAHVRNDHAYAVNADGSVQADSAVQVDPDEIGRLTSLLKIMLFCTMTLKSVKIPYILGKK